MQSVSDACGTFEAAAGDEAAGDRGGADEKATWKAGKFEAVLQRPFDNLAHSNSVSQRKEREIPGSGQDFEIWLLR